MLFPSERGCPRKDPRELLLMVREFDSGMRLTFFVHFLFIFLAYVLHMRVSPSYEGKQISFSKLFEKSQLLRIAGDKFWPFSLYGNCMKIEIY